METDQGKNILIDCGTDIKHSLTYNNKSYKDVDAIYISHLHGDHAGGLEYIGFARYFNKCKKPTLYIHSSLIEQLWYMLKPSMEHLNGKTNTIHDYFDVFPFETQSLHEYMKLSKDYNKIYLMPVELNHIPNKMSSFGCLIKYKKNVVFITTDTCDNYDELKPYYDISTLIFQDCEFLYDNTLNPIKSGVHVHYDDLLNLPENVKNKMILVHVSDYVPNHINTIKDGFLGIGQKYDKFEFEESYYIINGVYQP